MNKYLVQWKEDIKCLVEWEDDIPLPYPTISRIKILNVTDEELEKFCAGKDVLSVQWLGQVQSKEKEKKFFYTKDFIAEVIKDRNNPDIKWNSDAILRALVINLHHDLQV